jgi:ketosteroid isomerase-like protein
MTFATPSPIKPTAHDLTERCRQTAADLVAAFAAQDIETIMSLFADDATYCDVQGAGQRGDEYHGKDAIRAAFLAGFDALGEHTYEAVAVAAEGTTAFASWVLIHGRADDPSAPRFDGADHFEMDENARVVLKKGWLKGLSAVLPDAA